MRTVRSSWRSGRAYPAFMDNTFKIDLVNDNEYAVRSEAEGQSVESLFRIDPDYLDWHTS
jgi:hypothetical protein